MCVSEAVLQHSVEMHSHQDPLCAQLCRFLIAVLFPAYLRRGRPTRISALQQDSLLRDETGEQIQGLAAREHVPLAILQAPCLPRDSWRPDHVPLDFGGLASTSVGHTPGTTQYFRESGLGPSWTFDLSR